MNQRTAPLYSVTVCSICACRQSHTASVTPYHCPFHPSALLPQRHPAASSAEFCRQVHKDSLRAAHLQTGPTAPAILRPFQKCLMILIPFNNAAGTDFNTSAAAGAFLFINRNTHLSCFPRAGFFRISVISPPFRLSVICRSFIHFYKIPFYNSDGVTVHHRIDITVISFTPARIIKILLKSTPSGLFPRAQMRDQNP